MILQFEGKKLLNHASNDEGIEISLGQVVDIR